MTEMTEMTATKETASDMPQQRRAPFWVRTLFNPLAKLVLGSPLHGLMSRRLMLITFTGRKTGKRFTTPISYRRDGNVLTLGVGGSWWRNLRDGGRIQVRVRGRKRTGVTEVVTDEDDIYQAYQVMLAHNPTQARFMGVTMDTDGQPNPSDLRQAIRGRAAVVRVRLTD